MRFKNHIPRVLIFANQPFLHIFVYSFLQVLTYFGKKNFWPFNKVFIILQKKHQMIKQFLRFSNSERSDWQRAFWHIIQEPCFSQTCSFRRNVKNYILSDLREKNTHKWIRYLDCSSKIFGKP